MRILAFFLFFIALASDDAAAASHPTVKLLKTAQVKNVPGADKTIATIRARQPLTGHPTTLPVLDKVEADGRAWVRVRLPKRPNHSTGWIDAEQTKAGTTAWSIRVNRRLRKATIYKNGKTVRRVSVVVGAKRTPTPAGEFFITETVRQPKKSILGPYVLATSAYSNVLQEFAGGPGQIGLHGRTGLPDPLGSAASHGCIRFSDNMNKWLAAHIPAGTPLQIV